MRFAHTDMFIVICGFIDLESECTVNGKSEPDARTQGKKFYMKLYNDHLSCAAKSHHHFHSTCQSIVQLHDQFTIVADVLKSKQIARLVL